MKVKDSFHMIVKISAIENIQIKPRFSSIFIVGLNKPSLRSSIPCKCPEKETALTHPLNSILIDRGKANKKFD